MLRLFAAAFVVLFVLELFFKLISSSVGWIANSAQTRTVLTIHDVILLLLASLAAIKCPGWVRSFALEPLRGFVRGIGLAIPFVGLVGLGVFVSIGFAFNPQELSADRFWSLCIGAAFYVAVAEELLLRGLLQDYLERKLSLRNTVWVQGLVFLVAHIPGYQFNAFQLAYFFCAGALVTLIFLRWRSLWTTIGVHFTWNVAAFALSGFSIREHFVTGVAPQERLGLVGFLTGGVVLFVLVTLLSSRRIQEVLSNSSASVPR